jgi:hypothetical protein
MIYKLWKKKDCETRWIGWWFEFYNDNWIWKQIVKVLKEKQKIIMKMEGSYRNPISESNVGQTSFENKKKTCKTWVISTTRGGKVWSMDCWSFETTQLQTTISMEKDAVEYSPKWVGTIYFSTAICDSKL